MRERPTELDAGASARWANALFWLGAALYLAALYLAVRGLPFFSEDYTQLAWAAEYTRVGQALSLANEPLRPFQHLLFYVLTRASEPDAACARIPAFVMHLMSAWLVFVLARELGLTHAGAIVASFLFLAFPNVKNLVWSAAIGGPGRVVCVLAGLDLYLVHARTRKKLALLACLASFALALAFHESAIVLPVLCGVHALVASGGPLVRIPKRALGLLRDPLLASLALMVASYAIYLAFLRPARHHGLRSFDALPANVVKAVTSLAPEGVRALCVDGLRGNLGAVGQIAGGLVVLGIVAFAVWCVWRGSKVTRFAVLAVAVDLVLPMLSTGFVQRYSYLGSAFVAVALAAALDRPSSRADLSTAPTARAPALVTALASLVALAWLFDSWRDVRDYQRAGMVVERVLSQAEAARRVAGPGRPIALVDPLDMGGGEEDLPLFNWGLEEALVQRKVAGPWLLWRTRPFHTSTSVALVTRAKIEESARAGGVAVLDFGDDAEALDRR